MKTVKLLMAGAALLSAEVASAQDPAALQGCELHIWPTTDVGVVGIGSLSTMGGLLGVLLEQKDMEFGASALSDMMRRHLSPVIQKEEIGSAASWGLSRFASYRLVFEEPTVSKEERLIDAAAIERYKDVKARMKTKARLSVTTVPCYAELIAGPVEYHNTGFFGHSLETSWTLRDYGRDGRAKPIVKRGSQIVSIKNFPPNTPERVAAAPTTLREAYRKNLREWMRKKLAAQQTASSTNSLVPATSP